MDKTMEDKTIDKTMDKRKIERIKNFVGKIFGFVKNNKANNGINSIDNNNINNINNKKIEIVTFKKTPDGYCEDAKWVNVGICGKIEEVES